MAGKIGHKVVVDINLTSVDVTDEENSDEEVEDRDNTLPDDEEGMSNNQEDPPEEMQESPVKGMKRARKTKFRVKQVDRPVRERKPKQQFHCSGFGWSYDEKRKLLEALKKHSPSAIDLIQAEVPSKTKLQIKDFMNKINKSIHYKSDNPMPVMDWINMARDLVRTERKDYTDSLARATSIISCFDNHPTPAERTPDYKAIYQYLALVLEGKELPLLGPLESAVMLDLLHGVVDKIAMSNTKRQRQVMKWKYKLLSSKVDTQNNQMFIRQARKALSNDFKEFENASKVVVKEESGGNNTETGETSAPSSTRQSSTSQATSTVSSTPSSSTTSTAMSRQIQEINKTMIISHNSEKSTGPVPTAKKQLGPPKKRHKNSEVEFKIRRENDIIVSKNIVNSDDEAAAEGGIDSKKVKGNKEGVGAGRPNTGSDRIQVQGEEGADRGLPPKRRRVAADVTGSHPQPDSYVVRKDNKNTNESTEKCAEEPTSSRKRKALGRPPKGVFKKPDDSVGADSSQTNQEMYWRGPGRPAGLRKVMPVRHERVIEDPSEIPKKPSLYTLNPFCVPVSLLPLRSKPVIKSTSAEIRKESLPAIISKKHSPMFNSQKTEGITSVSIHRMAAVIPVSKQHILLPNSVTQKSQH